MKFVTTLASIFGAMSVEVGNMFDHSTSWVQLDPRNVIQPNDVDILIEPVAKDFDLPAPNWTLRRL